MEKITRQFIIAYLIEYTDIMDMLRPRYNYVKDKSANNIVGLWIDECWTDIAPFKK